MADVTIYYCPVWHGYDERAASLAAEIERSTPHSAGIAAGARSQFDVLLGDELVFSKQREGRFPEAGEVVERLA